MLFGPATVLPLSYGSAPEIPQGLDRKLLYADSLNKRVHEPQSACSQAVRTPTRLSPRRTTSEIPLHPREPCATAFWEGRDQLEARGPCSCHTRLCRAKRCGRTRKKPWQKADVRMRTGALKRVNEGTLLQSFKTPRWVWMRSCTLHVLSAEIVGPGKTHLIHFYKWCNITVCVK